MHTIHASLQAATTLEAFRAAASAAGFDEAMARQWAPHQTVDEHAHPFDADALMVQGEMWLGDAHGVRHLLPGDAFSLPRGTVHSERYGADGATYWVARRSA